MYTICTNSNSNSINFRIEIDIVYYTMNYLRTYEGAVYYTQYLLSEIKSIQMNAYNTIADLNRTIANLNNTIDDLRVEQTVRFRKGSSVTAKLRAKIKRLEDENSKYHKNTEVESSKKRKLK